MTPDQIRLVQDSFALVRPIREQAAALFYGRLFALDPSTPPLSAGTDLRAQGEKLMAALGFVVAALRRPGAVLGAVADLARRHTGCGVREEHYASVGEALLWTLGQGLGAGFTPELREQCMPVEAQFQLGHRSFFRYVTQPIRDSFGRAFREQ